MENFLTFLLTLLLVLFIGSFILMLSWNAVIPSLFALRSLDFAAAFSLLVTVWIIGRVAVPPKGN